MGWGAIRWHTLPQVLLLRASRVRFDEEHAGRPTAHRSATVERYPGGWRFLTVR